MGRRNYGIDLLRLAAMFFVVLLHQLLLSGGLEPGGPSGVYRLFWLMETVAYGAADLFALISGYVSYREEGAGHQISGLLLLWAQGIFYGVGVTLLFRMAWPEKVGWGEVLSGAFPVLTNRYWYLTAYLGLFLFMPALDAAVGRLSEKSLCRLCGVLAVGFSLVPTFTWVDFQLAGGYSVLWLMILYVFGAAAKKCRWERRLTPLQCLAGWGGLLAVTWVLKICSVQGEVWLGESRLVRFSGDGLLSYCSPTILLSSLFLLLLFSRLSIPQGLGKRIARWSSRSFAVYLINLNPCVWRYLLPWPRRYMGTKSPLWLAAALVGFSALFVAGGLALDFLRARLFQALGLGRLFRGADRFWNGDAKG